MIYAISSLAWQSTDWSLPELIIRMAALGYTGLEVNVATRQLPLEGLSEQGTAQVREVVQETGMRLGLHAPALDLNPISLNPEVRELTMRQYLLAARLAQALGAGVVTVHLGTSGYPGFPKRQATALCVDFFQRLLEQLAPEGPCLALENVAWGHRNPWPSVDDYTEVAEALDDPRVGFTLDLGHAHLAQLDTVSFIRAAGPRLLNLHVHDNDGEEDWHRPIGEGVIDFGPAARALAETDFGGLLIYEYIAPEPRGAALAFPERWRSLVTG